MDSDQNIMNIYYSFLMFLKFILNWIHFKLNALFYNFSIFFYYFSSLHNGKRRRELVYVLSNLRNWIAI
jgi:hypothetical protein